MNSNSLAGINDFASNVTTVPPQLRALIAQEVARQNASLLEEIQQLKAESAAKDERITDKDKRIAELEAQQNERIDTFWEEVTRERAFDRQRITKLEEDGKTRTQTRTSASSAAIHIDNLFEVMRRSNIRQVSARDAGRILGITARHVRRLKPHIAADKRFQIVQDPHHKQRHLIRLVRT